MENSNPIHHTEKIGGMLDDLVDHLKKDVEVVQEPKARALFETAAEVLQGLRKAFRHYGEKQELAWQ